MSGGDCEETATRHHSHSYSAKQYQIFYKNRKIKKIAHRLKFVRPSGNGKIANDKHISRKE